MGSLQVALQGKVIVAVGSIRAVRQAGYYIPPGSLQALPLLDVWAGLVGNEEDPGET
jgi:hypothetical protein